jgi:hypothetical protein
MVLQLKGTVIDPATQQSALYFRWIKPLLQPDPVELSIISRMLQLHLCNYSKWPSYEIPLVFTSCRSKAFFKQPINSLDTIYRTLDAFPHQNSKISLTQLACLHMPLKVSFTTRTTEYRLPKKAQTLLVSDVFMLNRITGRIHLKKKTDISPALLVTYRNIKLAIGSKTLEPVSFLEAHFESNYDPTQAHFPPIIAPPIKLNALFEAVTFGSPAHIFTAKTYRIARLQLLHVPTYLSNIQEKQWLWFWSLALTYIPRNVIYRFIVGKIPNRKILHGFSKPIVPSPQCLLCSNHIEDTEHLLFYCPSKSNIWKAIIFEFLWPTIEIPDIIQALTQLDFSNVNYSQRPNISAHIIIFITLTQIWKAHFRFIFDETPFHSPNIIASITEDITQWRKEALVHRRR